MKQIAFATATALMFATSAAAGGFAFSLPDLAFPPAPDVTVTKDCISKDALTGLCIVQE